MRAAASNEGGALTGFLGMGMAQQAGGAGTAQGLFAMGQGAPTPPTGTAPQDAPDASAWICPKCSHTGNTGKFCAECGEKRPAEGWACSCGQINQGKFCQECGQPKPADAPLYRCDQCGWEPEDPLESTEVLP